MKTVLPILFSMVATMFAIDQTGAESAKKPVSASIQALSGKHAADPVGNVKVTYEDGTTDHWTTKGNCGQTRVAPDGTVGWVIYGPEVEGAASYKLRPHHEIVLCRKGKIVARLESPQPFIEEWQFQKSGTQVACSAMFAHGKAYYTLFDAATGKVVAEVTATDNVIPDWARPLHRNK